MKTKRIYVDQLKEEQIHEMHKLMELYYEKVTAAAFRKDLIEKQQVILLLDSDNKIKGFSTILESELLVNGKAFTAIFSGDTVTDRKYWGNGLLSGAFARYLMLVKFQHPFRNVYWFLISKGYKTYLLMANNFPIHYPRFERATPKHFQQVMDHFYSGRYGNQYHPDSQRIYFESAKVSALRRYVAEITDELRLNPRVRHFETLNPKWQNGVELGCIAEVSLWMPIRYFLKRTFKKLRSPALQSESARELEVTKNC